MLKEKSIYYDPGKDGYYLVLSVSDMICGRYGDMENPSYLDSYMNQDGTGLRFKIDNIIINSDYIRNYSLDEKELDNFILKKELTDEEFYPIEILICSNYRYPSVVIDINNIHKRTEDISHLVRAIQYKETCAEKIKKDINMYSRLMFDVLANDKPLEIKQGKVNFKI